MVVKKAMHLRRVKPFCANQHPGKFSVHGMDDSVISDAGVTVRLSQSTR